MGGWARFPACLPGSCTALGFHDRRAGARSGVACRLLTSRGWVVVLNDKRTDSRSCPPLQQSFITRYVGGSGLPWRTSAGPQQMEQLCVGDGTRDPIQKSHSHTRIKASTMIRR